MPKKQKPKDVHEYAMPGPRDYPHDWPGENGFYRHSHCAECKQEFYGHKNRRLCRECLVDGDASLSAGVAQELDQLGRALDIPKDMMDSVENPPKALVLSEEAMYRREMDAARAVCRMFGLDLDELLKKRKKK